MRSHPADRSLSFARSGLLLMLAIVSSRGLAQHEHHDLPSTDSIRHETRLYDVMHRGRVEGRFRMIGMMTENAGDLSDYHALAFGGVLGIASERHKGFQFKLSGGFTFDLTSSDFSVTDAITGQHSRYEIALFDVKDPRNVNDLSYLHEFQLNYLSRSERTLVVFGKQELNTAFLNGQDGRMHPTMFEGLWANHRTPKDLLFRGGWLYRVAPRGTSEWEHVGESIGAYGGATDVEGRPGMYPGNLESAGIFAASISAPFWKKRLRLTGWNIFTENVFNTAMLRLEAGNVTEGHFMAGIMAIRQDAVANGGNHVDSLAYLPKGSTSQVYSGRLALRTGRWTWQANYTRITPDSRYLFPREWGREPLYTFLTRERNEGAGDVEAASINIIVKDLLPGLKVEGDAGVYWLPAPDDFRLNKYGIPSYTQYNANLQYIFGGHWRGLAAQVLYVVKMPIRDVTPTADQTINRVDMHHVTIALNYSF